MFKSFLSLTPFFVFFCQVTVTFNKSVYHLLNVTVEYFDKKEETIKVSVRIKFGSELKESPIPDDNFLKAIGSAESPLSKFGVVNKDSIHVEYYGEHLIKSCNPLNEVFFILSFIYRIIEMKRAFRFAFCHVLVLLKPKCIMKWCAYIIKAPTHTN